MAREFMGRDLAAAIEFYRAGESGLAYPVVKHRDERSAGLWTDEDVRVASCCAIWTDEAGNVWAEEF